MKSKFNPEKFLNSIEIELKNKSREFFYTLKGYNNILEFFKKEYGIWNTINHKQGFIGMHCKFFNNAIERLNSFEKEIKQKNMDNAIANSHWNDLDGFLSQTDLNANNEKFYSIESHGYFLIELSKISYDQALAAYQFFNQTEFHPSNDSQVLGIIKAYDFSSKESSFKGARKDLEINEIQNLRLRWEQKIQNLANSNEKICIDLNGWKNNFISEHEKWKKRKIKACSGLLKRHKNEFKQLEELYNETLKFDGPVKYWNERASKYKKQGLWWTGGLSFFVIILGASLFFLLYNVPDPFKKNIFAGDPLAIKGVIVFATFLSFAAYLVRVLAKMVFSTFHLQRDAEEREQLTHVFLSLVEKGTLKKEESDLILQSLFSRVDTGLVGPESSPAMPGVGAVLDRLGRG